MKYRKIAHFFESIMRYFWRKDSVACDYCGGLVGMASTISRYGQSCNSCLDSLKLGTIKPFMRYRWYKAKKEKEDETTEEKIDISQLEKGSVGYEGKE